MRKQVVRVRDYLREHNGITQLEATHKLGITRLSAVIFDMKHDGFVIDDEMVSVVNRYGEKTAVKRYSMISEPEAVA